jgi:hypothetical protein
MVRRKTYRPTRDEVTGGCIKLHYEELHNLYSSPNIITVIKQKRMRWAGHVARMDEMRNAYRILVVKREGKRPLGRPRIILKRILGKSGLGCGLESSGSVKGPVATLVNTVMNLRGIS